MFAVSALRWRVCSAGSAEVVRAAFNSQLRQAFSVGEPIAAFALRNGLSVQVPAIAQAAAEAAVFSQPLGSLYHLVEHLCLRMESYADVFTQFPEPMMVIPLWSSAVLPSERA